jgi:C4-dicarboxylate-specific signal transduction histidine kinase
MKSLLFSEIAALKLLSCAGLVAIFLLSARLASKMGILTPLALVGMNFFLLYFIRLGNSNIDAFFRNVMAQTKELLHLNRFANIGRIASGLIHDINTPLSAIQANTELLLDPTVQKPISHAQRIYNSLEYVQKIINAASQQIIGKSEIVEFSPLAVLSDVTIVLQHQIIKSQIEIHLDINPREIMHTNVHCFRQICFNLILNSIEAIASHSERWIKIQVENNKNNTVLTISDSGPGVSPLIWRSILENNYISKSNHLGLGLNLCRQLAIRELRGDLKPTFGDMGQFVLTIPQAPADNLSHE